LRKGYAYVGLSAQDHSISVTPLSLKKFSLARYGQVDVTGTDTVPLDGLSYDMFAQTSMAVRNVPALLGGLPVQKVIGAGMSQSGMRLGVYLNYLHMRAPVYDAFLIQVMNPVLRDDLTTPVIKVLSDTEATPEQLSVAQEDTATRRSWWVAGSSHGDTTQRVGRTGVRIRDLGLGWPTRPTTAALERLRPCAHACPCGTW
jgi:Alpha/beta hydrolase domain